MYVCMYVCMYAHIHTYIYAYMEAFWKFHVEANYRPGGFSLRIWLSPPVFGLEMAQLLSLAAMQIEAHTEVETGSQKRIVPSIV